MNEDLRLIKKYYGEKMMHYCRENFSILLEKEGTLFKLLNGAFYPTKELYNDLKSEDMFDEFNKYVFSIYSPKEKEYKVIDKDPSTLLKEAGYILYECNKQSDIMSFKKYYARGEELCTFRDNRLETCYVFFAVKENASELKREVFVKPEREDKYGTSVISIQFTRGNDNYLSIKNRYNHTVKNPDATYNNNLDNIISGLTKSFEKKYSLKINGNSNGFDLDIPDYVKDRNGRYYKSNYELNNTYYCIDNIILDDFKRVDLYSGVDSARYLLMECYLLDLKNKEFIKYKDDLDDYFFELYKDIKNISIKKDGIYKIVTIELNDSTKSYITLDKNNRIIKYINNDIQNVGKNFLGCEHLEYVEMNKLKSVGDNFIKRNLNMEEIYFPKLEKVGNNFLLDSYNLKRIHLPNLVKVGNLFIKNSRVVASIDSPKLKEVGDCFLEMNQCITEVFFPSLEKVGNRFLVSNNYLEKFYAPKLRKIGDSFLFHNHNLKEINLPSAQCIGNSFMSWNCDMKRISLKSVQSIGDNFLPGVLKNLKSVYLPNVKYIGNSFLMRASNIKGIYMPNVEIIENSFIKNNMQIKYLYMPKVKKLGVQFLNDNNGLKNVSLPEVVEIEDNFMTCNFDVNHIYMPNVERIANYFLFYNHDLDEIDLPSVKYIGSGFMNNNNGVKNIEFNSLIEIGDEFFSNNQVMKSVTMLNLEKVGKYFLGNDSEIKELVVPKLKNAGKYFLNNYNDEKRLKFSWKFIFDKNYREQFINSRLNNNIGRIKENVLTRW